VKNDRNQKIMAGVLALVLVCVLVFQLTRSPKLPAGASQKTATSAPASPTAGSAASSGKASTSSTPGASGDLQLKRVDIDIDALLSQIKEVGFEYELEKVARNPYTPLVGRSLLSDAGGVKGAEPAPIGERALREEVEKITVTGIIYGEISPVAVVSYIFNGKIKDEVVTPGFEFPTGVLVDSIESDKVVFRVGNLPPIPVPLKELKEQ
jgi:hypothetical protein